MEEWHLVLPGWIKRKGILCRLVMNRIGRSDLWSSLVVSRIKRKSVWINSQGQETEKLLSDFQARNWKLV